MQIIKSKLKSKFWKRSKSRPLFLFYFINIKKIFFYLTSKRAKIMNFLFSRSNCSVTSVAVLWFLLRFSHWGLAGWIKVDINMAVITILGGSSHLHQLYRSINSGLDSQYYPQYFKLRWRWKTNRQSKAGNGWSCLHHLVHPGVHTQICHKPLQVAICERRDEHYRRFSHPTILCLLVSDRIK